jgi:hypothetical protein
MCVGAAEATQVSTVPGSGAGHKETHSSRGCRTLRQHGNPSEHDGEGGDVAYEAPGEGCHVQTLDTTEARAAPPICLTDVSR